MRAPTRLAAALLIACIALPAAAGDLTGVWKGKFKCTLQDGDSKQKFSSRMVTSPEAGLSTLEITHPDGPDTQALQIRIDDVLFAGFVLPVGGAVQSGVGAIVDCDPNQDPAVGYGELRTFRWRVKPGDVSGTLSWRGMLVDDDAVIGTCKGNFRRISRTDPGVTYCR